MEPLIRDVMLGKQDRESLPDAHQMARSVPRNRGPTLMGPLAALAFQA